MTNPADTASALASLLAEARALGVRCSEGHECVVLRFGEMNEDTVVVEIAEDGSLVGREHGDNFPLFPTLTEYIVERRRTNNWA